MCLCTGMCTCVQAPLEAEDNNMSFTTAVTFSCGMTNMGSRNQGHILLAISLTSYHVLNNILNTYKLIDI